MLNKEYYAKEIIEIVTSEDNGFLAVDKHTKKPCKCNAIGCCDCLFLDHSTCDGKRNKWVNSEYVESIKLTLAEKIILENLNEKYKWIARDNGYEFLCCYENKPRKRNDIWRNGICCLLPFEQLFKFVKWDDKEPYRIEDILNNCIVEGE